MNTANRFWIHYCQSAGLSKEVAKLVVKKCEKRDSFNDIDYQIKVAKELSAVEMRS